MKIVIPGGSGQVGTILARAFHAGGDEVVVLSRRPQARPWRVVGCWSRVSTSSTRCGVMPCAICAPGVARE